MDLQPKFRKTCFRLFLKRFVPKASLKFKVLSLKLMYSTDFKRFKTKAKSVIYRWYLKTDASFHFL